MKRKNKIKLVIFDLDDTLTVGTTIWELIHKEAGTWESCGIKYWRDFCRGKFGYNKFIRMDIACWKGLPVEKVKRAIKKTKFTSGIKKTFAKLKEMGIKIAVISSSLEIFANYVAERFGIDHVHANTLEIHKGKLTGKVILSVPGLSKGRLARKLKKKLGLKKSEVVAVGDSVFDIPMFKEAGISVSFNDADKTTKKHADQVIEKNNIRQIMDIIKRTL
jgi:phosphoserine phosphatase